MDLPALTDSSSAASSPRRELTTEPVADDDLASESSSVEYVDEDGLVEDMQALLADCQHVADAVAVVGERKLDEEVAIHKHVLCLRSPFFAAALSDTWHKHTLRLPSLDPEAVRDVLEFLYTGAVRLEVTSGSAVRVAAAAHFLDVPELEAIVLDHLQKSLTPFMFPAHLAAAVSLPGKVVPVSVTNVLANFVAKHSMSVLTSDAMLNEQHWKSFPAHVKLIELGRTAWRLLVYYFEMNPRASTQECQSAGKALMEWSFRMSQRETSGPSFRKHGSKDAAQCEESIADLRGTEARFLFDILHSTASVEERDALLQVLDVASPVAMHLRKCFQDGQDAPQLTEIEPRSGSVWTSIVLD